MYASRAVFGSCETSEDVADVRVRIGLFVEGEMVVMGSEAEEEVLRVVSPQVG